MPGAAEAEDTLKYYALKYVELIRSLQECVPTDTRKDSERLECFDSVVLKFFGGSPPAPDDDKWTLIEDSDDFTDAPRAILTTQEEGDGSSCFLGNKEKKRTLAISCSGGRMGFLVDFQCWMQGAPSATSKGVIDIEYRAGSADPVGGLGDIGGDGNHIVAFARGDDGIALAKAMLDAPRLVVRASGGSEGSQIARFSLSGLTEAIKPLREACDW